MNRTPSNDLMSSHKRVLPVLPITDPSRSKVPGSTSVAISNTFKGHEEYYLSENEDFTERSYHHFPVLLNRDHSPWVQGNLYLLSKLKDLKIPVPATLESIAHDLLLFKRFIEDEKIDYLAFPKRKLLRPTYRYRSELRDLIDNGSIAPNTASRRISSVIGFYRWLEKRHDCSFEYPAWQEKDVNISFLDQKGFLQIKPVVTTDLAVSIPKNREEYSGFIQDGGKLKPLSRPEQKALIEALKHVGNTEMTLAFLIALTTGARIQTVFTLRLKNIDTKKEADGDYFIYIGPGSGVDTKFKKQMVLYMPQWLRARLMVYAGSERARKRRERSKHPFCDPRDHYLFLTSQGKSYYVSEADPSFGLFRRPPNGGTVREFISSTLEPALKSSGHTFSFRFHDLRATYGLNLFEEKIRLVEAGKAKLFDILMFIKGRMGHSSLRTTEHYLEFRKKFDLAMSVQSEFEDYLMNLSFVKDSHE